MKKPLEIMMKAMDMLEIPKNNREGRQNLNYRLPEIVEHLLLESLGDGEPRDNWVEESIRVLKPNYHEGSPLNRRNVVSIYENLIKIYEFIKLNGIIETENMKRFRDYLGDYQRITEQTTKTFLN
jgi:hypothetical protein